MYTRVPSSALRDWTADHRDNDNPSEPTPHGRIDYVDEGHNIPAQRPGNKSLAIEQESLVASSISDLSEQQTLTNESGLQRPFLMPNPNPLLLENPDSRNGDTSYETYAPGDPNAHATTMSGWSAWTKELLSSFLALGCIISIAVLLFIYQEKPLPKLPKLISINTLVAVFTAVFKASLVFPIAEGLGQLKWDWFGRPRRLGDIVLFDDASRGPWGSLIFMAKGLPRSDREYLAILGAFITVTALAIDPFSQAIISHRTCQIISDFGQARVSRANNYTYIAPPPYVNDTRRSNEMPRAIWRGLVYPPEEGELIGFSCSSGNCTFEGGINTSYYYSSLAVCYSCEDITEQVVLERPRAQDSFSPFWHFPWSNDGIEVPPLGSPPLGKTLAMTATHENMSSSIHGFDILSIKEESDWNVINPFAARCKIDACVLEYSARVSNGRYTEKSRGKGLFLKAITEGDNGNTVLGLLTDSTLIDGTEKRCEGKLDHVDGLVRLGFRDGNLQQIRQWSEPHPSKDLVWKSYPPECVWIVDSTSLAGMKYELGGLLQGDISSTVQGLYGGYLWNMRLFSVGNISMDLVNDMATGLTNSMTATLRNLPVGSSETLATMPLDDLKAATGQVLTTQTCIHVEWGWIAYPVSLVIWQWTFLTLMLVSRSRGGKPANANQRRPTWKSSPLALLFHGIEADLRSRNEDFSTVKQMDTVANEVSAHLVPVENSKRKGWKFTTMQTKDGTSDSRRIA